MTTPDQTAKKIFQLVLIKPSHYDDDGYVIQWMRSYMPSNTMATIYGLALDCAERKVLGDDVEIRITVYDETNTRIEADKIAKMVKDSGGLGLIGLVGVQSNQYPRAVDIARQFREADMQVCIGGFHVSGCIAMLKEMPEDLKAAMEQGITLFAGEAEQGRLDDLLLAAYRHELKPLYNYMGDLPDMPGAPTPFLPATDIARLLGHRATFDAGRGCPFLCSFCTIINVQGRKSRSRTPDDVERLVRANLAQGINSFFITDDNFARNQDWEAIFDRLIHLREVEGLKIKLLIQVDTMCHKIPGFIEKAGRAGVNRVFIGLENINPESLKHARKGQNRITEYRALFQAWHSIRVLTFSGYIIGFPNDTLESIERDIKIIQRELPVDILEFFILTPLPGSRDHKELYEAGATLDLDMNNYDTVHVVTPHATMSNDELQQAYLKCWDLYYTPEHVATVSRRAKSWGYNPQTMVKKLFPFYACIKTERIHPLEGGLMRRKYRRDRRPGLPLENPVSFYSRYAWETLGKYAHAFLILKQLKRIGKRVRKESIMPNDADIAMQPVDTDELDKLEMFTKTEAARITVEKVRRRQDEKATMH